MASPIDVVEKFQKMDFDYWLERLINHVSDEIDTREGSVIYDALAPVAAELEVVSQDVSEEIKQSYTQTATGERLEWNAAERGVSREKATQARVLATFVNDKGQPINNVNVGDRFGSIVETESPIYYTVLKINEDSTGLLQADEVGTRPNSYTGQILPVTPNDILSWAEIIEISVPARNDEDDESLRTRALSTDNYIAYGGNVADYQDMIKTIDDVGAVQIYPAYKGGGTVKLAIINNNLLPASKELINYVKEIIDPFETSGQGYGLAPIGHRVTVVTPTALNIDVDTVIKTDGLTAVDSLLPKIKEGVESYFAALRTKWNKNPAGQKRGYATTVFRSQILAEILKIDHITNAEMPKLNGQDADIDLTFNNEISEIATLGGVTVHD